jgi:hypothetical protein
LVGLVSGELLGLQSIEWLQRNHLIVSASLLVLGAGLCLYGWKNPE